MTPAKSNKTLTPLFPLSFLLPKLPLDDRGVLEPLDPPELLLCDRYDTKEPELIRGGSSSVSRTLADFIGWQ